MPKFVPRQRKYKARDRQSQPKLPQDTNVAEVAPVSKEEKEEKRQKLREELRAQQSKISGKKQKRLDKYIDIKLRKDENLTLIEKLAKSKVDTSQLQSSRSLARSHKPSSRKSQLPSDNKQGVPSLDQREFESSGSDEDLPSSRSHINVRGDGDTPANTAVGSGLKRPLEIGEDGRPIIKRRKRASKARAIEIQEPVWEGFDSEPESNADEEEGDPELNSLSGSDESDEESNSDLENEENSSSDSEAEPERKIKPRQSAFKSWAVQQINEAAGFTPDNATAPVLPPQEAKGFKPRNTAEEEEPLPQELRVTNGDSGRKSFAIQINRPEHIQSARLNLPVVGEEQKIMEAIHNNPCVVIWGATGSGKTTQLPQFLFEAGYGSPDSPNPGMIGITQPRRVAAVSMAKRVGEELAQYSDRVSYQIRFDTSVTSKTAIKFMTDGVLIREVAQDFSLSKYSTIIIDEAHERSVNTDLLIGMVSRIVDLRKTLSAENPSIKPLKLVIMSATLRTSDFLRNPNLFRSGTPPLVQAEGRQFPVTIHFSRRTHRDYVEEAFRKVCRGHRKLPPGGFLVFLTGQSEIKDLSKRLKAALKSTQTPGRSQARVQIRPSEASVEADDIDFGRGGESAITFEGEDDFDSDIDIRGTDEEEEDDEFDEEEGAVDSKTSVHVLPLYSQLPTTEQLRIFEPVPEGSRLIVLATNVAETSLTIPGIRYVFDCGRSKEKQYDLSTGVQSFPIGWISKASASQRAGRAGRTGPGHCYRLYSSAVYEDSFSEHTEPEILRTPIEGVVLQMKHMGLHHIINFPFPTPPDRVGLAKAERLLKNLAALSADGQVTDAGQHLTLFPLSPRFGKMLHIGHQHGCMPYTIALVSALSVSEVFIQENQLDLSLTRPKAAEEDEEEDKVYTNADRLEDDAREQRRKDYQGAQRIFSKYDEKSDAMKFLTAVCAYAYAPNGDKFCSEMFLRPNAMKEASQLRRQISNLVRINNPNLLSQFELRLREPSDKQISALKQITAAGFIDQVAIRADAAPVRPDMPRKPRRAIDVPYLTLFPSRDNYSSEIEDRAVYIHPSSVLAKLSLNELPQYVVYSHLQQSTPSHIGDSPKVRMFPLTPVSGLQLSALAQGTPLIEYGKPIGKVESLGGLPEKRECWVVPSLVGESGSTGWPLPAKKVIQVKDKKHGWIIDRFVQ
ncbi:pre-mRNA-splicing factor ATP-dependent RNA helicase PRP43 [Nannizzia gypsea CBS 118893]|uniref:RNA helicase n=1 Tax=Arthroderma gypseum (strain ATCC MYA-4604 / CBS 118893) TaxID=535722 RepID=E5QYU3_ARTGP|nr:pre-mRNA-splicing factor ATP-dependent RNA helicase PRP43 [Nannizzia gypsea CBS 118893]EFQ97281.1 pre-mRNA-splicing factor ATP-dependent RNA helicase PRP43 [Nannizzia gypsea CBS 118893]